MGIFLNYIIISWYFIIFDGIYILIHFPFDINMLFRKSGTKYPNPPFKSFLEGFLVVVPSLYFWGIITILSLLSLITQSNILITLNLSFIPVIPYALIQITGLGLMSFGLIIGCLGRIGRGLYLAHEKPRIVQNWGYRIVRHPNYAFYIYSFIGILLLTTNLWFIFLILGIFGYNSLANTEEKALREYFGSQYALYQKKVGKLIPKIANIA